jgi:glycerol kinase
MMQNDWLAQRLADISGITVERPGLLETTALGAARLAGLQAGVFDSLESLAGAWQAEREFVPGIASGERQQLLAGWQRAVAATLQFAPTAD